MLWDLALLLPVTAGHAMVGLAASLALAIPLAGRVRLRRRRRFWLLLPPVLWAALYPAGAQ